MTTDLKTKPLVDPTSDVAWLKRKIALWQKAEREAKAQLNAAQDQLAYYRDWLSEIDENGGQR